MSGHSKWSQIKRGKEVVDKKRSLIFGKLSHDILLATSKGLKPIHNADLRDAIARARKANMPQVNIDRLLERRAGQNMETIIYEGFGPKGTALLITTLTNNPNRTVSEIRSIFKDHEGQLGVPGSVQWKFDEHQIPKYPMQTDAETQEALAALVSDLEAHNDIVQIATDIL
jgi:YebC/PmpR family DNA-binding regulatory protein